MRLNRRCIVRPHRTHGVRRRRGLLLQMQRGLSVYLSVAGSLFLASVKSILVLPFWYRLTRVVPEKGPLPWASTHRGKWGQLTPVENGRKIKKRKHAKKISFLCLCYILRAIGAGRCRERCYADHIFIQINFRMRHFVVKFSKFSSPQEARGHWLP